MKIHIEVADGDIAFEADHEGETDLGISMERMLQGLAFGAYCAYGIMMDSTGSDVYDDEAFEKFAAILGAKVWDVYEDSKDIAPIEIKEIEE